MRNKYHHFILGTIIFFIFVFIYKITEHQIKNYQIEKFSNSITAQNEEIRLRTIYKENLEKYISTNAYKTQIAKSSQNKFLPWENVIYIVSQEDINGNTNIDSQEIFYNNRENTEDPTAKMSNPERWKYLFQNGIQ